MFGIFSFILIFILLIILIAFALIGNVLRFIFGLGRRAPKHYYGQTSNNNHANNGQNNHTTPSSDKNLSKKKIFGDDEGEYVEFEEVP